MMSIVLQVRLLIKTIAIHRLYEALSRPIRLPSGSEQTWARDPTGEANLIGAIYSKKTRPLNKPASVAPIGAVAVLERRL